MSLRIRTGGRVRVERVPVDGIAVDAVIDEHFLGRYRELLDAEDAAFDELEHAFEDGDRVHFDAYLAAWRAAITRKLIYLQRAGHEIYLDSRAPVTSKA